MLKKIYILKKKKKKKEKTYDPVANCCLIAVFREKFLQFDCARKQVAIFSLYVAKYYQLPFLGTLNMSGHFYQKTIIPTCRKFDVYLHAKNELSIPKFFFEKL